MQWFGRALGALLFACSGLGLAFAAESLTELPTGGIAFLKLSDPASLAVKSEEVTLSPDSVRFDYEIFNKGATPLEATLAFRFPELDFSDPDAQYAIPGSDPVNFLDASFAIDGKAAPFTLTQRASLNGKDVTDLLRQARLALTPIGAFQNELADTPPEIREKLSSQGLLVESGTTAEGKPLFFPSWTVKTSATRKITIAPQQKVRIGLRYRASVGSSPDTVLRKALRDQKDLGAEVRGKRAVYCVDDGFLGGLDKLTGVGEANDVGVRELRIHLATAQSANPQIVAEQYRLVVDKGAPQRIVSFCSDNLKKISPTAFEMRAENFAPNSDLNLLVIDRAKQGAANQR